MKLEVECEPHRDYGARGSVAVSDSNHDHALTLVVRVDHGYAVEPVKATIPRAVMLELREALLPWLRHKAMQP